MAARACSNSHDLRVLRTNRYLKEAFIRLLGKKSYEQITVQEICRTANVRRTTFYQHFQDKQDFLAWFIQDKQREFSIAAGDIIPDNLDEYMALVTGNVLKYLKENAEIVRLLQKAGAEGMLLLEAFSKACIRDVIRHLESNPRIAENMGNVPVPLLAAFCTGGLVAAAQWWIANDPPCTEEDMARHIRSIVHLRKISPLCQPE